jgi:hypothetical protein
MLSRCGINIPSKGKFHSPFRPDNNPSCEIYGECIKDRSTGNSYDSIAVFAEVNKISNAEAIKRLGEELPGRIPNTKTPQRKLIIPKLCYSPEDAEALSKLRGISRYGIDLAATTIESLGFGMALGHPCWMLTDGIHIAEARRMDGAKFPEMGSLDERKSHTLAGSKKSFPIGLFTKLGAKAMGGLPIMLVEGGPDYLAACDVAWHSEGKILPVAMLGSSSLIDALALPHFKGRSVLILAHPDDAGVEASRRWAKQLHQVGAKPRVKQLVGGDLNDLVRSRGVEAIAKEVQ